MNRKQFWTKILIPFDNAPEMALLIIAGIAPLAGGLFYGIRLLFGGHLDQVFSPIGLIVTLAWLELPVVYVGIRLNQEIQIGKSLLHVMQHTGGLRPLAFTLYVGTAMVWLLMLIQGYYLTIAQSAPGSMVITICTAVIFAILMGRDPMAILRLNQFRLHLVYIPLVLCLVASMIGVMSGIWLVYGVKMQDILVAPFVAITLVGLAYVVLHWRRPIRPTRNSPPMRLQD